MKPSYRIAELEKIVDAFRQRAFEAERERDDYKLAFQQNEQAKQDLFGQKDLLITANLNIGERARKAERERDELRAIAEEQSKLAGSNAARAQKAEAELARRDAAAGEAAAGEAVRFYREHNPSNGMKTDWIEVDSEQLAMLKESTDPDTAEFRTLYTAAPPAVLPPVQTAPDGEWCIDDREGVAWLAGANWMREQALKLGAQPQKVVEFPAPSKYGSIDWQGAVIAGCVNRMRDKCIAALDAANVKWEVKK